MALSLKTKQDWPECHFDKRTHVIGYAFKWVVVFSKNSAADQLKKRDVDRALSTTKDSPCIVNITVNFLETDRSHGVSTSQCTNS